MTKKTDIKTIEKILEMSKKRNISRSKIAEVVGVSKRTVWKYQHEYGLA